MDDTPAALDYYRRQCDELGGRMLRLQEEATQARHEAQRNRTLTHIIQQLSAYAHTQDGREQRSGTLGDTLLGLMMERLRVDAAALLRREDDAAMLRIEHGLGVIPGLRVPTPIDSRGDLPGEPPQPILDAIDVSNGIWVAAPPSPWILLLGQRQRRGLRLKRLDPANRSLAAAALKVYTGLLEQIQSTLALRASEANYRALFENAQDAILVLDLRGLKLVDANQQALTLFDCSLDRLRADPPTAWLAPSDPAIWRPIWKATLAGRPRRLETRIRTAAGRLLWTEINLKRIEADQHRLLVVVRDISARKETEEALRRMQERLELALEGAEVGLYDANLHTGEVFVDERYLRLLGDDPRMGTTTIADWLERIHPEDRLALNRLTTELIEGRRQKYEVEYRVSHASGNWIWILDRGKAFDWDATERPRRIAGTCVDISARKHNEASIHRLAFYDPLTDLPNRRLFLDRLATAHAGAQRNRQYGAVFFVDLDHFKKINDTRGHEAGDHLLQEVAARLRPLLRAEDTVARFGGDEFVILLVNLSHSQAEAPTLAHHVADKVRLAMAMPFRLPEGEFLLGASIGVTLFNGTEPSVNDILREADTALYRAKESGRNRVCFFEASMQSAIETRGDLEGELRHAASQDQLRLFLQPQVDADGNIVGVESLLRWQHPTQGLISPAVFIPLAEESNLILPIGQWVLTEACRTLARISEQGRSLRISVNVSAKQFCQPDLVSCVRSVLASTSIDPTSLVLEITEGVVIDDVEGTIRKMHELKALGVRLSIDDFGTGYSSLGYLKRLPVDELKIDRTFVRDAPSDASDAALIEAILAVSRHLHLDVVAEGVETLEQLNFLKAHGCNCYQGYLYGMPVPAEQLLKSLAECVAA